MLSFVNDYSEGAHERILARLLETNREQLTPYGDDIYCASAREKIRRACAYPGAQVFFLTGGTQTNKTVLSALLAPYEGVVSAASGHIGAHEAGAVEDTGHKVLPLPHREGKLAADGLRTYLRDFYGDENREHMVFPGVVYLSFPTEYGTQYSLRELEALAAVCAEYRLRLYLDGARLGYGLAARGCDVTLADLARLCDAFYIGGTKVGALCGEAVVFPRSAPPHFMTTVKKQGALLAKGRLLGVQFDTLFTDGLYLELGRRAVALAQRLREAFLQKGYRLYGDAPSNQIFVVLENGQRERLGQTVAFAFWERVDDAHTLVRFATSWATEEAAVDELIALL